MVTVRGEKTLKVITYFNSFILQFLCSIPTKKTKFGFKHEKESQKRHNDQVHVVPSIDQVKSDIPSKKNKETDVDGDEDQGEFLLIFEFLKTMIITSRECIEYELIFINFSLI